MNSLAATVLKPMESLEQFLLNHPQLIQPSLGQSLRTAFFALLSLCMLWMFFRFKTIDLAPMGTPIPKWAFNCWRIWLFASVIVASICTLDSWNGALNQPTMNTPFIGIIALVGLICFVVGTVTILKITVSHSRVQKRECDT